jgi:hypothetical protein
MVKGHFFLCLFFFSFGGQTADNHQWYFADSNSYKGAYLVMPFERQASFHFKITEGYGVYTYTLPHDKLLHSQAKLGHDGYIKMPFYDEYIYFNVIDGDGGYILISEIILPTNKFNKKELQKYVENKYLFSDENMKKQMIDIFRTSGVSKYTAEIFLAQLSDILCKYLKSCNQVSQE